MLRCLVVSWSEQRAELFRAAAENEAWQAIVCRDVGQFIRNFFRQNVPLTIVDLPRSDAAGYTELKEAAARSLEVSKSLLVVSVAQTGAADELWARQLGVWAHLPEVSDPAGLEMVFREARKAVAKQAISHTGSKKHAGPTGHSRRSMDKSNSK